jgi:hypothetical protein
MFFRDLSVEIYMHRVYALSYDPILISNFMQLLMKESCSDLSFKLVLFARIVSVLAMIALFV